MATTPEYMDFVCDHLQGFGPLRTRKMFGDYVVYLADKPILLVCDNAIFVKKRPELAAFLADSPCGVPYEGAKGAGGTGHPAFGAADAPAPKTKKSRSACRQGRRTRLKSKRGTLWELNLCRPPTFI